MWDIFWKISRYERWSHKFCKATYFFIDQQSVTDQSVVAVNSDYWNGYEEARKLGETLVGDMRAQGFEVYITAESQVERHILRLYTGRAVPGTWIDSLRK